MFLSTSLIHRFEFPHSSIFEIPAFFYVLNSPFLYVFQISDLGIFSDLVKSCQPGAGHHHTLPQVFEGQKYFGPQIDVWVKISFYSSLFVWLIIKVPPHAYNSAPDHAHLGYTQSDHVYSDYTHSDHAHSSHAHIILAMLIEIMLILVILDRVVASCSFGLCSFGSCSFGSCSFGSCLLD